MHTKISSKYWIVLAGTLMLLSSILFAQNSRVGTIDYIRHDDGYIVINDMEFSFSMNTIQVIYKNQRVRPVNLQRGIVVRYEVGKDDEVTRAELLGPANELDGIFNN